MLAEYYYETYHGCYPFKTSKEIDITRKTANYLQEAGFANIEIIQIWDMIGKKDFISPEDLPASLWESSLLDKDTFYFHHELQLPSQPLVMNEDGTVEKQPFKLEMKIKYTIDNLLNYYYSKTNYCVSLRDYDKDKGAMQYLLNKYSKVDYVESIDFVLGMIDYAVATGDDLEFKDIFSINSQYAADTMQYIKYKVAISKQSGYGKIIWR